MPAFSTNLTHLEINMNSKLHGSALLAHSKTLVDLTLYGPKDTSNWAPFMADSSQRIRFSNLKTLHLNYEQLAAPASANAADSSEQMSPPTLEFPMLEHLTYQNRTRSVPFFNIAQLPPKLKSLCIRGDYNTLKYIAGIDLPQTNALTISYIQSNEYKAASELINQIFAKNPSEHLGFLCDTRSIKLNLLDICCPKLNRIRVAAPTGFYSIIEAIDKHPRLASLAFENVVPGDCSQRLTNELLTNKEGLPPFTARVVSLSLGYRELDYPQDTMLLFAKYLLLRLTYLQRVCLRNLPSSLFTEFIKTNKNRYPHLENVVWVGN
ncbi:hypothetical protein IWW36_001052 [Coemansia brasiliensis]|uniref:Uncharacterized protein n=1 Tax=Coemansia brasiliensis TaxID=2650707 RepID=A0A9W8IGA3_9FUNG|nr:hypothetical protein IWW36_001052 [Coemansia brasiliensis]